MSGPEKDAQNDVEELRARAREEPVARFLDMKLLELAPGYARVAMKLRPEYCTFTGFTFGGIIMCIADEAFQYGVNSMGRTSIASQFNIHFVSGASPQDELIAECRALRKGRRVDIAEMTVTNQEGKLIARATGTSIPMT